MPDTQKRQNLNMNQSNKDRFAPDDAIWVCAACGKTSTDRYGLEGEHSPMWDESCMLNAVLCKRNDITPGQRVTKAEPYEKKPI